MTIENPISHSSLLFLLAALGAILYRCSYGTAYCCFAPRICLRTGANKHHIPRSRRDSRWAEGSGSEVKFLNSAGFYSDVVRLCRSQRSTVPSLGLFEGSGRKPPDQRSCPKRPFRARGCSAAGRHSRLDTARRKTLNESLEGALNATQAKALREICLWPRQ
jgi:hypothetical protein